MVSLNTLGPDNATNKSTVIPASPIQPASDDSTNKIMLVPEVNNNLAEPVVDPQNKAVIFNARTSLLVITVQQEDNSNIEPEKPKTVYEHEIQT